jgi:hypothetical protein
LECLAYQQRQPLHKQADVKEMKLVGVSSVRTQVEQECVRVKTHRMERLQQAVLQVTKLHQLTFSLIVDNSLVQTNHFLSPANQYKQETTV